MLVRQVRYSALALLRVPGLTLVSVLTAALGVGASTALFSVVKAVLLNPLPYAAPDRLAWVAEVSDGGAPMQVGFQNFLDWRNQNHTFSALAAYADGPAVVAGGDVPRNSYGAAVTGDFFRVLGAGAALGRTFSAQEQAVGGPPVVVLGHGLWQRAFGGTTAVLGRSVRFAGLTATVIGIMPAGFSYPEKAELWMPAAAFGDPGAGVRTGHNWKVIGRLKFGVWITQAQADIDTIELRIKQQYPSPFQGKEARVVSLQSHLAGEVRAPLLMLFGAVGFLLLIVCVNIANLLLVHGAARARELAVRTALGAGRRQLFGQMLTESLLLGLAGGLLGLLMAAWSMDLLRALLPVDMPRAGDIRLDLGVMAFALALSAACGLLFGCLPAWRASSLNVGEALKTGSRNVTTGRRSHRTQAALVVSEACLSLILVAAAALLMRSFWKLRAVDPGFRSDGVLTAETQFESGGKRNLVPQYRDLLERVRAIPGVQAAGTVRGLPIEGGTDGHFFLGGRAQDPNADANYSVISPGYLQALRIPLLRGRDFSDRDTESSQPVAIVTAEMARVYFPGRDPIGERVWFDSFSPGEHWMTIVGVAGDVRQSGLAQGTFPQVYACYTQQTYAGILNGGTLVVRSAMDPAALAGPVRAAIQAVNPEAAPAVRTMEAVLNGSLSTPRFQMEILGGFAVMALLLAATGLYGVLSHTVAARRAEIGIRLALGAPPDAVFRMVVGRGLALAAAGVAAGALGCVGLRGVLSALLFGIGPNDPLTLVFASTVLLASATLAAWIPAYRASRVDPVNALREE